MKIPPFWRYYGGKHRAAARYPAPLHGTIIEPFAGAAGYACNYAELDVVLVEKDPKIAAIWRYLISATPGDILAIGDIPEGGTVDDLDAPQAAKWLAGFWCNDGAAQPCKTPSKWAMRGRSYDGWNDCMRSRIAAHVRSIRHWNVIEGDYTDCPDVRATWFVDPPYQTAAGRHYKHNLVDFAHLSDWVQSRKGQIIACDQAGSDWLPWNRSMQIKSTSGAGRDGKSNEVYWYRDEQPQLFGSTA
jgi:site-specific DNA-adenine methylase